METLQFEVTSRTQPPVRSVAAVRPRLQTRVRVTVRAVASVQTRLRARVKVVVRAVASVQPRLRARVRVVVRAVAAVRTTASLLHLPITIGKIVLHSGNIESAILPGNITVRIEGEE